ncbi:MAG TPA: DUF4389 domain-containing protein [Acidimicrobiia bacterium]|nr:DUF4389 domain-containing protein [Acidimicrobiia bacterium]
MQPTPAPYPTTFTFDAPERITNWRPFVQWIMAIPHWIIANALNSLGEAIGIVSWFIIVFTGALPESLANLQCMIIRYATRNFTYAGFLREEYPPFAFDMTAHDPGSDPRVRLDFQPQLANRNRATVFFRIILVIPHVVVLAFLIVAAVVVYFIAAFAILFTGKWPEGMRNFVLGVMRWGLRVQTYFALLTDEYPPFALN